MTGFTHVYLPLVSDYSQVLCAQQDSLTSIQLPVLLVSTKVHNRSYLQVFSTCQQSLASSVLLVSHEPNTQLSSNFLEAQSNTRVFCKLGRIQFENPSI